MEEKKLFVSWGQVPRGRESKAIEIFQKAHEFLKKKKKEGKIKNFGIYFNVLSADMAGFLLLEADPDLLINDSEELEYFYMQAAAVVDNISSSIMIGGTDTSVMQHINQWQSVQKEMGFI